MIRISEHISIGEWEITESFSRASGPGGQNVNKVSTGVDLRFEAMRSPHLTPPVKRRLARLAGHRWTKDGAVLIHVEKHRSQAMNREAALEQLVALIQAALVKPKPRIKTRPTLASKRRRLDSKKKRGDLKKARRQQNWD